MAKLFDIQDTTVAIPNLTLTETQGSVTHRGDIDVAGNLNVTSNINVTGTITANTFNVKNLVTDNGSLSITGNWIYNTELELNGKGFNWTSDLGQTQLVYRTGKRLWTNANLDIDAASSYNIDNIPALSATALGNSVITSNLNTVGTLNQLQVSGDTALSNFVFVNSSSSKIGIGTNNPSAKLTVLDNNIEIGIGSSDTDLASVGTKSNHDFELVTNNRSRIKIKRSGEINVGDPTNGGGVLNVYGTLFATSIVTADKTSDVTGSWVYDTELELNGKGFNWTYRDGQTQLIYRTGGRLWTTANLDIAATSSYNIDNIPVLSATTLGSSVRHSNLSTVGTLNRLAVSGDTTLGDFVFVNSTYNRIGIGTDEPSASLTILDNNVEIGIGSPDVNLASIGTQSNHDLELVTDGQTRVTIKRSGEVNIGDPANGGGVLNVYGTLFATSVVTDNRVDRTHPIQFNATKDTSIYGLGLLWNDATSVHRFVLDMSGRLISSDSIEVAENRSYYINGVPVLSANALGSSVSTSSLNTVGILESLTVAGNITAQSQLTAQSIIVDNGITLKQTGIDAGNQIALTVQNKEVIYGDQQQVNIGDIQLQARPVKVYGPLSVNINNPDPTLQFSVNGDVSIGGKRFTNGASAPISGAFNVGDICYNTNPIPSSYIGWVCVTAGTPGQWLGFGLIASQ